MKIVGTQSPHVTGGQKQTKKTTEGSGDFKKLMDQAMYKDRASTVQDPKIIGGPIVEGIKPLVPTQLEPVKSAIGEIEKMLDRLDFYAEKLADESIRSHDLSPLLADMESGIKGLEEIRQNPNMPSELNDIVSDLLSTIGAEIEKFRRGDYL